jgi:hypothetical protein
MNIKLPDISKLPKIVLIILALGIFALCVGAGVALVKYGKIEISRTKIEKAK